MLGQTPREPGAGDVLLLQGTPTMNLGMIGIGLMGHGIASMVTLLAEAAARTTRQGVSPEAFVEVLAKGGGGIALQRLKPYVLARDPSGLKHGESSDAVNISLILRKYQ